MAMQDFGDEATGISPFLDRGEGLEEVPGNNLIEIVREGSPRPDL